MLIHLSYILLRCIDIIFVIIIQAFKLAFSLIGKNRNKNLPDGSYNNVYSLFADFFQNKVLKIIEDLSVVDSIYF